MVKDVDGKTGAYYAAFHDRRMWLRTCWRIGEGKRMLSR